MAVSYLGLFLASFLSATVVPLGSEALFGLMLVKKYNPYLCIIFASLGNWLGGLTCYALGLLGKWEWLEKYFHIEMKSIERTESFIKRWGGALALFCWLPIVGDLLAVAFGFFRLRFISIVFFMLAGKTLRYIFLFFLADLFVK